MNRIIPVYYQLLLDCSYSMEPVWEQLSSQVRAHFHRLQEQVGAQRSTDSLGLFRLISIPTPIEFPPFSSSLEPLIKQLNSLFPEGGSSLWDTIASALNQLEASSPESSPLIGSHYLVVISDGWENGSSTQSSQVKDFLLRLQEHITLELWFIGPEHPIPLGGRLLPLVGLDRQTILTEDLACCLKAVEDYLHALRQH
ncbi:MAG: hypothetical protein RLZ13_23 [Bacteroidota bacterium]|jgi:hypothetical protein